MIDGTTAELRISVASIISSNVNEFEQNHKNSQRCAITNMFRKMVRQSRHTVVVAFGGGLSEYLKLILLSVPLSLVDCAEKLLKRLLVHFCDG